MSPEALIQNIQDARFLYVRRHGKAPKYVALSVDAKMKIITRMSELSLIVLVDESLEGDKFRLLRD